MTKFQSKLKSITDTFLRYFCIAAMTVLPLVVNGGAPAANPETGSKGIAKLINDPSNDELNKRLESPYLDPKHFDKFYGKLPRLYLHGMWKLTVTPNPAGRNLGPGEYFFDDAGMKKGFTAADFDDSSWSDFYIPQKLTMPIKNIFGITLEKFVSENQRYSQHTALGDGYSYLATRFVISPEQRGKRVILHFDAVNSLPVVFVNGQEAGRPKEYALGGSVDSSSLDITPWVKSDGVNRLVVRTYNQFYSKPKTEWNDGYGFNCNGVWRPAWVEFWDDIRAEKLRIKSVFPDAAEVQCTLLNPGSLPQTGKVSLVVTPWKGNYSRAVDEAGKRWESETFETQIAAGKTEFKARISLPGIRLWHMESPYLYEMRVYVDGKLAGTDTFGVRSIKRDGRRILVNGIPAYFFGLGLSDGFCIPGPWRHYELLLNKNGVSGDTLAMYKDNVNINAVIRSGNWTEILYQICDELGLARWGEETLNGYDLGFAGYDHFGIIGQNKFNLPCGAMWSFGAFSKGVKGMEGEGTCMTAQAPRWVEFYKRLFELYGNHPALLSWTTPGEIFCLERSETALAVDIIGKYKQDDRLVGLDGVHFYHTEWRGNKKRYVSWAKEPGNSVPGVDFVQEHNRPLQNAKVQSLGFDVDELHLLEKTSADAYPGEGGLPLTASPALSHSGHYCDLYFPRTPEEVAKLEKLNPLRKAEYLASLAIWKNGAYDKKSLCDFASGPAIFGYASWGKRYAGLHTFMSTNEERYRYLGFDMQQLGELMRWHSEFFRGYGFVNIDHFATTKETMIRLRDGLFDPAVVVPQPTMCAYTRRMQQRILPLLDWHFNHNLFAGENHRYELRVLNDGTSAFPGGTLTATLRVGEAFENFGREENLPVAWKSTAAIPEIIAGERYSGALELKLPAALNAGRYTMMLVLADKSGQTVSGNTYPINIGRREAGKVTYAERIGVYVGTSNPEGEAFVAMLEGMGLKIDRLKDFSGIGKLKYLVLGPGALDEVAARQAEALHAWLSKGGRMLCMEQKKVGDVPFLNQMRLEASGFQISEPVDPKHPAFAGLERVKDWDTLNGGKGSAYDHVMMPMSESVLAIGGTHTSAYAAEGCNMAMTAAEVKVGAGVCLFNQLLVSSRYDTDPQARRFVQQLVAYFVSPRFGEFAQPARGEHKSRITSSVKNVLKDTNFSPDSGWVFWIHNSVKDAGGSITFQEGKVVVNLPATALLASKVRILKQLEIDVDSSYKLKLKAKSSKPGKMGVVYQMNSEPYTVYAIANIDLEQGEKDYECTLTVKNDRAGKYDSPRSLNFYFGGLVAATVTLSDVSFVKLK